MNAQKNHRYSLAPGFIGPLTRNQTRRREINRAINENRKIARAAVPRCPTQHARTEPWDCGCSFGCDCCRFGRKCLDCGDLLR